MNIHTNARTCPNSRAVIVDHVRARAWSEDQAAEMGVSTRTGFKWWRRFREAGAAGLIDRSSRPHRVPHQTSAERTELVLQLRRCRLTAQEIARKLRMPRSTVSAVLKRNGMGRLRDLELAIPSCATSVPPLGIFFTSTSRHWAESAVSATASQAIGVIAIAGLAGSASMSPSTTIPGWRMSKSSRTKRLQRRPAFYDEH